MTVPTASTDARAAPSNETNKSDSNGLSTGSIVGIAIGAAAGVAVAAGLLYILRKWVQRRQARRHANDAINALQEHQNMVGIQGSSMT